MIQTENYISGMHNYYAADSAKGAAKSKAADAPAARSAEKSGESGQVKLSKKAQALLDRLKKTYGNIDFMTADFENADEAKQILSRGTKEVSVLFTSDELEKMASSEKYEKENISRIQGALRMSEQINEKYGFESAFSKNGAEVTKTGIAFSDDGTASYFAELEKSSEKQREYIEKKRDEKRADKQEANKKLTADRQPVKRTTVQAGSVQELMKKIESVNWDAIKAQEKMASGRKVDFSC